MWVAPGSSMFLRCGGESRQPEKACASVWYPAPIFSAATFASYPDDRMPRAEVAQHIVLELVARRHRLSLGLRELHQLGSMLTVDKPLLLR